MRPGQSLPYFGGDRQRALDYYGRFVDLWKRADAELQPNVRDVQQRIRRLRGER